MKHLGILATTREGTTPCFRAFCQDGFAEIGAHDHPDMTLGCIALPRSLPAWQAGDRAGDHAVGAYPGRDRERLSRARDADAGPNAGPRSRMRTSKPFWSARLVNEIRVISRIHPHRPN
jgi:hypothetical protein